MVHNVTQRCKPRFFFLNEMTYLNFVACRFCAPTVLKYLSFFAFVQIMFACSHTTAYGEVVSPLEATATTTTVRLTALSFAHDVSPYEAADGNAPLSLLSTGSVNPVSRKPSGSLPTAHQSFLRGARPVPAPAHRL